MRFGALIAAAVLAVLAPFGEADAATITAVFDFSGSDFTTYQGFATAPVSPVIGKFTLTFDPTQSYLTDTTTGLTLDSLNVPLDSPVGFQYDSTSGWLTVGGTVETVTHPSSQLGVRDFGLSILYGGNSQLAALWYKDVQGIYIAGTRSLNTPVAATPVPAALPLFGAALLGLGGIALRRKRDGSRAFA